MDSVLVARNIEKSYSNRRNKLRVLKGIDLSVECGKAVFIVGPSGAGKSTLLHILGGLDKPDKGTVILNGADIYSLTDSRRADIRNNKIGFVFQFYHLLPEFTAVENVMLPALIQRKHTVSELRKKARILLDRVGLSERVNHRPAELSGGEQQRVAIARALINDPDILFCDEPTGNLDSNNGKMVYELLMGFNRNDGMALLVVTHQREVAMHTVKYCGIKDGILTGFMV